MQDCSRLKYKVEWMERLRKWIATDLKSTAEHVIFGGDMNVALTNVDISNPSGNKKSAGFTKEERDQFKNFLGDGWIDTWRHLHPVDTEKTQKHEGAYTYWNTRSKARERNAGWRIDGVYCGAKLLDASASASAGVSVEEAFICPQYLGSDHCPVGVSLTIN
jgi:exodeoxyribonuclease-3